MSQVNVNPGGGAAPAGDGGFSAGMIIGIILIILIILVLIFVAGPTIFVSPGGRSLLDVATELL